MEWSKSPVKFFSFSPSLFEISSSTLAHIPVTLLAQFHQSLGICWQLTNCCLLNFGKCLVDVTRQVVQKDFIFPIILEDLPQITRLFPVFVFEVGGVGLDSANPFAVRDIGGTSFDLAERGDLPLRNTLSREVSKRLDQLRVCQQCETAASNLWSAKDDGRGWVLDGLALSEGTNWCFV